MLAMRCWVPSESSERDHLLTRLWCEEATGKGGRATAVLTGQGMSSRVWQEKWEQV